MYNVKITNLHAVHHCDQVHEDTKVLPGHPDKLVHLQWECVKCVECVKGSV